MRTKLLGAAMLATLALIAAPAFAAPVNLVQNGSFELGNYVPNQFTICECSIKPNTPQASAIANWTVVAPPGALPDSGIDWLQNFPDAAIPQPSDGVKNIDLSGDDPGAIQQSVATTAGVSYTVTFDVGSNEDPSVPSTAAHTLEVLAGPADQTFTIPRTTVGYLHEQLVFTATSSSSLLEFIDTDTPATSEGPVLDNVDLFVTPPLTRTATTEDSCENGGFSTESNVVGGTAFTSQAACDAFVTGTTLTSTLPFGGICSNVTFTGTFNGAVIVPIGKTCLLAPGSIVNGSVALLPGSTLFDEGATIRYSLSGVSPNGVDIDPGSQIGGSLNIVGLTGVPATESANEICGATVGLSLTVTGSGAHAPVEVGCADEGGNRVGGDIIVDVNCGPVTVADNTADDLDVSWNLGNVTATGNNVSGNATADSDFGTVTVNGNNVKYDLDVSGDGGATSVGNNTVTHDLTMTFDKPGGVQAAGNTAGHRTTCQNNAAGSSCGAPTGHGI